MLFGQAEFADQLLHSCGGNCALAFLLENCLEFEEVPQPSDLIQVNPHIVVPVDCPLFGHDRPRSERRAKQIQPTCRISERLANVVARLGIRLIGTLVEDQFGRFARRRLNLPQFEPPRATRK